MTPGLAHERQQATEHARVSQVGADKLTHGQREAWPDESIIPIDAQDSETAQRQHPRQPAPMPARHRTLPQLDEIRISHGR